MLDAKTRNLWLIGILALPVFVAMFTAMVTAREAGASFSVGQVIGASIGNLVVGSIPRLLPQWYTNSGRTSP